MTEFSEKFKLLFRELLNSRFGESIRENIREFREDMTEIEANANYPKALGRVLELLITNSWYYPTPKGYKQKFKKYIKRHGDRGFTTTEGKEELLSLVKGFSPRSVSKTSKLIKQLQNTTIRGWTEKLYDLARQNKKQILGQKGRDNYLRDFGYFDRAPMDRHEMRFIVRTGIYHNYSARDKFDPLERSHLQTALANFCEIELASFEVEEINNILNEKLDLGKHPGMVDLFVWYFCSPRLYAVCTKKPKCEECTLKECCSMSQH